MRWIDRIGGTLDERLAKIGIGGARERAWRLAMDLIDHPDRTDEIISARDRETAHLEGLILEGVVRARTISRFIARTEPADVRQVIDAFAERTVDLDVIEAAVQAEDTTLPVV
jgi:predicted metal-dependent enzyme (double-stranded beta helix superfamily)